MMTFKAFNFRYLSPITFLGFLSLFYSGSAVSQSCSEGELLQAMQKAGHNSELTKELKDMAGSWTSKVKKKQDAKHPWTITEARDDFVITNDGKHLRHDTSVGETKTTISLSTFNAAEKKHVMATCEGENGTPVVMTGSFKESAIKYDSAQMRASTFIKSATEMSSRVSLLKKDSPTSLEPREITLSEVSFRRLPSQ